MATTNKEYENRYNLLTHETATHKYHYAGKWFQTTASRDRYKEMTNAKRRAARAGYPIDNAGVEAFLKVEAEHQVQRNLRKLRLEEEQRTRDRIREEFDLHPKATVTRSIRSLPHTHITQVLADQNQKAMSADQRIALIKSLYDDKTNTLADILIKTRQLVGADIETLKGRN